MPYIWVRMPYFCRNPLILTDFYAIQTPVVWHIFGAYFLQLTWAKSRDPNRESLAIKKRAIRIAGVLAI